VEFTRALLEDLHGHFKDWVRSRREGKLRAPEEELFDGSYMIGSRALAAGLVDRLGDVDGLVREMAGPKAKPLWLRPKRGRSLLRLLGRGATEAVADVAEMWRDSRGFR
jgi:ClpP class serine protease